MSTDFNEFIKQDRRLVILRFLAEDNDYKLNDSVLSTALEQVGHNVSRDVLRSELVWLKEQGLIKVDVLMEHIYVATLTERGLDVSKGLSLVPGVKRPSPRG